MVHEEKKVGKIVEELTMFFFSVGADKMSSSIEREDNTVKITFRSNYLPEHQHAIHSLEKYLDEPRNEGIEDIYWELAGSGDPGEPAQLLLIGMMVDRHEIKKSDNEIEVVMYKELLM